MKKSIKLALRASEIRSDINKLDPGEDTIEKRRELLGQLDTVETEYRAALTEEAEADATQPDAHGITPEERAFRALESRAELRHAFHAVMDGKPLTGAAKELQEHRGLSGHDLPWEMVAPRPAPRAEHRADAVSGAPADSHLQQHGIIGRVFARSATMTLGVQMPQVAVGEAEFSDGHDHRHRPQFSRRMRPRATRPMRESPLTSSSRCACNGAMFSGERNQGVLSGLEEALRNDLSMAVSDLLDAQVLAGDGTTGAQFDGFLATAANGGLTDRSDTPARVSFALAAGETARGIDGKYAGSLSECAVVIGDDTARDLASKFQTNDSDSALAYMGRTTMRTMASANIPDVAATYQEGILARMGASGANSVCPVWSSMFMIRDEITGRKSGQIAITVGMLAGFDILRAGAYQRLKFKVST